MPTFSAYDTTPLAYHLVGEGEPLIVLPGGPMRASAYLGDLGGLSAVRQLALLDLRGTGDSAAPEDPATYRCDRLVDDVEALRRHLGLDRIDLFDQAGIGEVLAQYRMPQSIRIRRALACNENLDSFDPREVQAARLYEEQLGLRSEIDFEATVTRALHIVREHAHVRDLLRSRFPHLAVDEYQDLGGVLHELVLALRDLAGITVFAVGGTGQSVYGFSGADAKYLTDLAGRADFLDLELEVNYRSGQGIITAAEAALGLSRGRLARRAHPRRRQPRTGRGRARRPCPSELRPGRAGTKKGHQPRADRHPLSRSRSPARRRPQRAHPTQPGLPARR